MKFELNKKYSFKLFYTGNIALSFIKEFIPSFPEAALEFWKHDPKFDEGFITIKEIKTYPADSQGEQYDRI